MKDRIPFRAKPMLATPVAHPFHRQGWAYEEKYDGYRILAYKEGPEVTLVSRNGRDRTGSFREVAASIAKLPARTLLLDGEVVAFDRRRVSRFQLLQQGGAPAVYVGFDCLFVDGRDLRRRALTERRAELEDAIDEVDGLVPSRRLARNGLAAYRVACRKGYEGLVAKEESSLYEERRSRRWLKVKAQLREEFVIGGYSQPGGTRLHFGALLLGAYAGSRLHYVGKVGAGFSKRTLDRLARGFRPLVRSTPPFVDPPREKGVTWLEPRLVAQVAFNEWTYDRRLRQPAYLGLRDDKQPRECVLPAEPS